MSEEATDYTIFNREDDPAYWYGAVLCHQKIKFLKRMKAERARKPRGQLCKHGDAPRVVRLVVAALRSNEDEKLVPRMREIVNDANKKLIELGGKRSLRKISEVLGSMSGVPSGTIRDWCQRADRGDRRKGGRNYRG